MTCLLLSACIVPPYHAASNGSDECDANNNSTQFDQRSGLGAASVAMVPLPGPLAGGQPVGGQVYPSGCTSI